MVHVWETHSYHFLKNLYELRHWDKCIHLYPPQSSHISTTRKQSPDSVGTSQRNQAGEGSQGLSPKGHCVNMSLPSRSWAVPWNQAKKQFLSVACHQPLVEGAGLEEMLPIISSLRQKLKSLTSEVGDPEHSPLSKT